jgi:hypothetical protein
MKLTDEQYQKVLDAVRDKWKAPAQCPVCHSNNWDVSREVYELREFQHGGISLGGSALVPIIPVTCGVCGNTVLLNALLLGIDMKESKSEPATAPAAPAAVPGH